MKIRITRTFEEDQIEYCLRRRISRMSLIDFIPKKNIQTIIPDRAM